MRGKIKESVSWVACPFCKEEHVIAKVCIGGDDLKYDDEETQSTKSFGTPAYLTGPHAKECQSIVGTFKQRQEKFSVHFQKKLVNPKFKKFGENKKITKTILLQNYGLGRAEPNLFGINAFNPNDGPFLHVADFSISKGKTLDIVDFPNPFELEGNLECKYLEKENQKIFQFFHGSSQEPAFWCSTELDFQNS